MVDFTKFTNEELEALDQGDFSKLSNESLIALEEKPSEDVESDDPTFIESAKEVAEASRFGITAAGIQTVREVGKHLLGKEQEAAFEAGIVEGIPFAKDIAAGASAAVDTFADADYSVEEFKEKFEKESDDWQEQIKKSEAKYYKTFLAGDLASSTALTFVPGGAGLKGATLLGAASGLSRSDDRELTDALLGGVLGFGSQKAGEYVQPIIGERINIAGEKLKGIAAKMAGKFPQQLSGMSKREVYEHLGKFFGFGVDPKKTIKTASKEFGEEILEEGILKVGEGVDDTLLNVIGRKKSLIDEMDNIINAADAKVGKAPVLNTKDIYDDIIGNVERELLSDVSTAAEGRAFKSIKRELDRLLVLDKDGVASGKMWKISKLNEWRKKIDKLANTMKEVKGNTAGSIAEKHLRGVARDTREIVDTAVENLLGGAEDALLGVFKKTKKRYANMLVMEKVLKREAQRVAPNSLWGGVKEAMNIRRAGFLLGFTVDPILGGAALAVDLVVSSKKFAPSMAAGLKSLSKFVKANPDSKVAARFLRSVNIPDAPSEFLDDELAVAMSSANLQQNPLDRTNEALINNAASIATILRDENPDLAKEFNRAMESQDEDELARIGSALAQFPDAKQYMQPGQGFNGKFYNPEEKQAALEDLNKPGETSYAQRLLHKENIKRFSKVPEIVPEEDKFLQWKSNKGQEPSI